MRYNPDCNSGSPQGLGELVESRIDGKRQLASSVYPLTGVEVLTETMVARILMDSQGAIKKATGVELTDGRIFSATEEVILSAGAYRTPQILLHSGVGAMQDLETHGIQQTIDLPEVGHNLHDHMSVPLYWKLRHPEEGLALGSPKFINSNFAKGTPLDWIVTHTVPHEGLKRALAVDEEGVDDLHPLLSPPRSHIESFLVYVGVNESNPVIPMDGSHVVTSAFGLLPTSRGTVNLASSDPAAAPLIDPNYYATEADRYVLRTGLRKIIEVLLNTKEGQAFIEGETAADNQRPLDSQASDAELDERIKARGK